MKNISSVLKTNRLRGGLLILALTLPVSSLFAAVTTISQLDNGCAFQFACFSDSRGEMDENTGRALGWIKTYDDFAIGLGDIFGGDNTKDLAFQSLWRTNSFWHTNLYPTFGNHCSIINGGSQVHWGRPYYTLTNLNTSSWSFRAATTNLIWGFASYPTNGTASYPDRKIDYYVKRTFGSFNVHMIVVYKNDRAPFARMSAQFMLDKLNALLAAGKTKHDIIMLLSHEERWLTRACTTDGYFPGPMTRAEVEHCFESSDIVIGASDHQFRRMNNIDTWGLSNPALYVDSGQVWNTASTEGYLEFHVFDDTNPFVTCQYINADITSRILHVGRANNGAISIKDGHTADSQYPMKKVIDGAWTQPLSWTTFNIPTPPTSATCHFDTPTGNLTTNVGSTVYFALSASDPDGVERVKIFTNGTEVASDSSSPYTFNVTFPAAGTYTVTAQVKDLLGNYTAADNSRIITVQAVSTTTNVPWVTNLTVAAAGTSITNAGLVVSSVNYEYNAAPAGTIFSQTPGGGTVVNLGSSVALAASLGPSQVTLEFISIGAHDGWVDESSETSNVGGTNTATYSDGNAIRVGDTGAKKQRKGFLSFDCSALPDDCTITAATLKMKRGGGVGTPTSLGSIVADVKNVNTGWSDNSALQNSDFEGPASASSVVTLSYPAAVNAWATGSLNATGLTKINKTTASYTQYRVRFTTDDDNDTSDDYLGFYSGENATVDNRPVLVVTYE